MTINQALDKAETLTQSQLAHMEQLCQVEIDNYLICIENYPPERMERYGKPCLARLIERKRIFTSLIKAE
jgi:hypothetical protein